MIRKLFEDTRDSPNSPPALLPFVGPFLLFGLFMQLSALGIFEPVKRGFFADDETISFPNGEDAVPYKFVLMIAFLVLPLFMVAGSFSETKKRIFAEVFIYYFGLVLMMVITAVLKLSVGRLRPDFIDRCQPDYSLLPEDRGDRYFITEDICTGREHDISEGRKSHPSGHSATSAFCGVYALTVWLRVAGRRRIHPGVSCIMVALITFYPVFVAITRVTDYKHHPLDAFAGFVLGGALALYTAYLLNGWVAHRGKNFIPGLLNLSSIRASFVTPSPEGSSTPGSTKVVHQTPAPAAAQGKKGVDDGSRRRTSS